MVACGVGGEWGTYGLRLLLGTRLRVGARLLGLLRMRGAMDTVIPRKIAGELELPVTGKSVVLTAKGSMELDEYIGVLEVMGKRRAVPMLVSDEMDFALLGVTTLELLRLEVDPTTGKLKESVAFLL